MYEKCGGCSFLHSSIDVENETKQSFVKSTFKKNKIKANASKARFAWEAEGAGAPNADDGVEGAFNRLNK